MDKIYCIECEYFKYWKNYNCDRCNSPKNKKVEYFESYRAKGQTESEIWRPREQNKNNDCKYFKQKQKQKWWKKLLHIK